MKIVLGVCVSRAVVAVAKGNEEEEQMFQDNPCGSVNRINLRIRTIECYRGVITYPINPRQSRINHATPLTNPFGTSFINRFNRRDYRRL